MFALLPVAIIAIAVQFNYNTTARTTRGNFAVILALVSVGPIIGTINDLCALNVVCLTAGISDLFDRFGITWSEFFWIWMVVFSGPFFSRLCRRLADAGMSRHWALLGLIPYLNIPLFLYLCFKPSSEVGGRPMAA